MIIKASDIELYDSDSNQILVCKDVSFGLNKRKVDTTTMDLEWQNFITTLRDSTIQFTVFEDNVSTNYNKNKIFRDYIDENEIFLSVFFDSTHFEVHRGRIYNLDVKNDTGDVEMLTFEFTSNNLLSNDIPINLIQKNWNETDTNFNDNFDSFD